MILELLKSLFQALLQFAKDIWQLVFGDWNYQILFCWLPADIQSAVDFLIIFLFGIALFAVIKRLLPF